MYTVKVPAVLLTVKAMMNWCVSFYAL